MASRQFSERTTVRVCYTGYVVHAVINNLAPLLFVIFNE